MSQHPPQPIISPGTSVVSSCMIHPACCILLHWKHHLVTFPAIAPLLGATPTLPSSSLKFSHTLHITPLLPSKLKHLDPSTASNKINGRSAFFLVACVTMTRFSRPLYRGSS